MAAFDFDGTMIAGDSFLPFLIQLVGRRAMGQAFVTAGPELAVALARRSRDATKAAMLARLLAGYPNDRIVHLGQTYSDQLVGRIRPAMVDRVAWHRQRGHRLVMVSASLEVYLAPVGQRLDFDQVLATRLEVGPDGRLTGRLQGSNVRGAEKSVRLRHWLSTNADTALRGHELWAYGDSAGDRELLAMADHPVRV